MKNNYRNIFLEQPRRGKTRGALITPHKRSAVWGQLGIILALLFLSTSCRERVEPPTPYDIPIPKG
ncbi:MAG: hypothetical protein II120_01700, partial [Bacteroidales bacterium]|nr:hypothetical protein [Bacteroidales bacterium]